MMCSVTIVGAVTVLGVLILASPAGASDIAGRFTVSFTTHGTVNCGRFHGQGTDLLEGARTNSWQAVAGSRSECL